MPVDLHFKYQLLAHNDWEHRHLQAHSDLLKAFNDIKVKENMITGQKTGKTTRRDYLLTQKKNMTISLIGNIELAIIDREDNIETKYQADVAIAKKKFDDLIEYYDTQRQQSLAKCKREFESKKRILEARGEVYDAEKSFVSKTGAEISLEIQKYKALKAIKTSIEQLEMSRNSVKGAEFSTPLPEMPEPLPGTPPALQTNVTQSKPSIDIKAWLEQEDASTVMLREEARAEDRRARREAEEAETARLERGLAYRRQLEYEAEQRRRDREERDRLASAPPQPEVVEEVEEKEESEDDMTQEEREAYIAEAKQRNALIVKKGIKHPR